MRTYFTLIAALVITPIMFAQLTDKLFFIRNPSPGVFWFSSIGIGTGVIDDIELAPIVTVGDTYSSCVNVTAEQFYLCNGIQIFGFDANGMLPMTTTTLPLPPSSVFVQVVVDPCDGMFYGVLKEYANGVIIGVSIVSYDPLSNNVTSILPLPLLQWVPTAPSAEYDPSTGVYIISADLIGDGSYGLACLDVHSGEVLSADSMVGIPGESFGHWALGCRSSEGPLLYGTSIDHNAQLKYLGVCQAFDPVVSHISESGTPSGFWKPYWGGSCVDQGNNVFYWAGAGGIIIGASLDDGSYVYNASVTSGELMFLEHFSTCECNTSVSTNDSQNNTSAPQITCTGDMLHVTQAPVGTSLYVIDASGRVVQRIQCISSDINIQLADLKEGSYVIQGQPLEDGDSHILGRIVIVR
ncbi:MAG: hypothetical protein IPO10_18090 [Flavobacteriales bacterium]|nr:hypothetical protein [Flavobacteriales bacterium]